ncbi:type 1 glutamine amidotransferase domain-containing protein [Glycomyces buryatensis]|uniref:Type 1 glutamine amidotransferase domain-containing protein n=1 Tax=Glycomyces buryatensis TaxID=2570927 RepID=A0A4S8PR15_9ACTN|nr:type 1 glutamine amidotransferase domain-containing protein [Glycomyces buryatensis]THV33607.1 type 1 glutamine amidotransferase domain-containing protein [Glycomyces buryatensis]
MSNILFIMTGANEWTLDDGSRHLTGFWAEEAAVPLEAFKNAGHTITVATPGGVVPPVDAGSLSDDDNGGAARAAEIRAIVETAPEFATPVDLAGIVTADFDAVFVPGGHGPMEDLAVNADSGRALTEFVTAGKPVGVICHGPAALLAAVDTDGVNSFAGRTVAAFTNEEERLAGLAPKAKWLLEDRLREAGVNVVVGVPFEPHVEVDGNVITGQNPSSSAPVADAFLKQL